jgi:carbon-monoxide dehydrogenase large subunit
MTNPIFGRVVRRIEDPRFLTGHGRYVETVRPKGALRAVFVRSIIAHGRLESVDVDAASSMPGVVAVLTAADLSLPDRPPADDVEDPFDRPVPASGTVRYVGEPVALVLAETLGQASDAAENVVAHVETLDVVVGVDAALRCCSWTPGRMSRTSSSRGGRRTSSTARTSSCACA